MDEKDREVFYEEAEKKGFLNWRSGSTPTSPCLDIYSVTVATIKSKSLSIMILINETEENKTVETLGLVDSGAGGQFIDQNYTQQKGFKTKKLDEPIMAFNVDGTKNKRGTITSFVDLMIKINERWMNLQLLITGLGKRKIILGFPWLNEHNPDINWRTREFSWRQRRPLRIKRRSFEDLHPVNHWHRQRN